MPFPSPGDLPDPGIEPGSPTFQADALTSEPPGKPTNGLLLNHKKRIKSCYLHGWTLKVLCEVKSDRERKIPYDFTHMWNLKTKQMNKQKTNREQISGCCLVVQSCPTLCNPMDCSTPALPVPHHLLELAQVHVHCISNGVQHLIL